LAIEIGDCGLGLRIADWVGIAAQTTIDNLNRQSQSAISIGTPQSQFEIRNPKIRNQQSPIRN